MPRPDRLPRWAYRIVIGSYELEGDAKVIWTQVEHLDQGPDGAWIGTEALAERCGLPMRTFERHHAFLVTAGLLAVRRRGPKHASRYPVLPCRLPAREELIPTAIVALDAVLRRVKDPPPLADQGGGSRAKEPPTVADQGTLPGLRTANGGGSSGGPLKKTAVGGGEGLRLPADVVSPPTQGKRDQQPEARSREPARQSEDQAGDRAAFEAAFLALADRTRVARAARQEEVDDA